MTAKEFLMLAQDIDARIEEKVSERERIQERLTAGRGSNLSGMPRGGRYDWTDAAAKVADLDRQIADEIRQLCSVKRQVIDAIDAVEDARYRRVLEMHYRNYMRFDDIAEALGYDIRHVRRLHAQALDRIRVPDEFA